MTTNHNKEQELLQRFGKAKPYSVPKGYFDTLPDRVMEQIAHKKKSREPWRWAVAALLVGCVASVTFTLLHIGYQKHEMANIVQAEHMDEFLDYNLVSNLEIETYLTEAE